MYLKNNLKLKIGTPNGFENFDGISISRKSALKIYFKNNVIVCSSNHKFIDSNKTKYANELKVGDILNGYTITDIKETEEQNLYDIVNSGKDNVFYANGIVSHNCEFIGSSATLISSIILNELSGTLPLYYDYGHSMRIFEKPKRNSIYVLGIDVAEGVGTDASVVQVLKIINDNNEIKFEQVAVYENNSIKPHDFAQVCISISKTYNNAEMMIESNNAGSVLTHVIYRELDYDYLINYNTKELGIRSTKKTKYESLMNMKKMFDDNKIIIYDTNTIEQLSKFEETKPGSGTYKVKEPNHDDLVLSLNWGLFFIEMDDFENLEMEDEKYKKDILEMKDKFKMNSAFAVDEDSVLDDDQKNIINELYEIAIEEDDDNVCFF